MNVAEWLAATARLRPDAPALLTGFDLDADYATFARRAAAIGAALARDHGIAPGDRVALFAQQLHAISRMPLRHLVDRRGRDPDQRQTAWPRGRMDLRRCRRQADVRLRRHGGALCRRRKPICRAGMNTLSMDSDAYRAMRDGEGAAGAAAARGRRSRLAVLHLGHHRPPEGRDAQPRQSGGDVAVLSRRRRSGDAARCRALCRADLARRGPL